MTTRCNDVARWKTPEDLRQWLAKRFERLVAADLRRPGAPIDAFRISTPGLAATVIADRFADVHAWTGIWQDTAASEPELDVVFGERQTRNFGRVRIPKIVRVRSIDGAARLVGRTRDLNRARKRHRAIVAADGRLVDLADQWPWIVGMSREDFAVLCRFVTEAMALELPRLRLREVPCAGMHTKFLEDNRRVLKPILAAWDVPPNPDAQSWTGRLGFVEDDGTMFELRDLDGGLLPFPHLALPAGRFSGGPPATVAGRRALRGVIVVENQATFRALPRMPGIVAVFGRGFTVRILGRARWLADRPLLYLGDLDHAGFQMVAGLRRDGLGRLRTALMDETTAEAHRAYWVIDRSTPGADRAYEGLTEQERATQRLMAAGPWRLEQERIPFDLLVERLEQWRRSNTKQALTFASPAADSPARRGRSVPSMENGA